MGPRSRRWVLQSFLLLGVLAQAQGPAQQPFGPTAALGQDSVATADKLATVDTVKLEPGQRHEIPGQAVSVEGLISLNATVTDQAGKVVAGLQRDDFRILDNGTSQKIVAFRASNGGSPTVEDSLTVIILLDTLDLSPDLAANERHLVVQFLRSHSGKLAHQISIYSLDDSGLFLMARSSTDGNALANDVDSGKREVAYFLAPKTHLPFNAVIERSFDTFPALVGLRALGTIATEQSRLPGQKLLFWVGPGMGTRGTGAFVPDGTGLIMQGTQGKWSENSISANGGSTVQRDLFQKICWFSQLLRQARVTLDCVATLGEAPAADTQRKFASAIPSAQNASWMSLFKNMLALDSGGRILFSSNDLVGLINDSISNAEVFYSLTFDPPLASHADEYHSLKVEMSRPGLTVHTSTGYYDQPFYSDSPAPARQRITVSELQKILQSVHGSSAARRLADVTLTERLSQKNLSPLLAGTHDKKLRDALQQLAAESTFLNSPPEEISAGPPPDPVEQNRILTAAAGYLDRTIPTFPSFAAIRTTTYYREVAPYPKPGTTTVTEPLHAEQQWRESVRYRRGNEIVESAPSLTGNAGQSLKTYGTFGPVLTLLRSMAKSPGDFTWKKLGTGYQWARRGFSLPPGRGPNINSERVLLPEWRGRRSDRICRDLAGRSCSRSWNRRDPPHRDKI
jgi:VWFA-related protein